jgi:hypothetical protein
MAKTLNEVVKVSDLLAEKFIRLLPLKPPAHSGKSKPVGDLEKSTQKTLEEFYEFARLERQRHGFGVINRARVAYGVQKKLLEAGYPSPLVKQVLFAMLISAFSGN